MLEKLLLFDWANIIIAFGGGGILTGFFGYLIKRRTENRTDLSFIVNDQKKEIKRLRYLEQNNSSKISSLLEQINELRTKIILLESTQNDLPVPMWLKDSTGKMLFVNKEYESFFLSPIGYDKFDYIGNDDQKIWGKEIAEKFRANDLEAMRRKGRLITKEKLGSNHSYRELLVIKYPRKIGTTVIGIAGVAIPLDLIQFVNEK